MGVSQDVLGKLVDVLQVASILSAAAFAALALFTEYKHDGKITRFGRIAVAGIVLSALFSLGTQWGKAEIDRQKAEAARLEEAERRKQADIRDAKELGHYRNQMQGLSNVLGLQNVALDGTRDLLGRMQTSLHRQQLLEAQARGTLLAVEATRSQEKANTIRVLRGMWDESNRVSGGRIVAVVAYQCAVDREKYVPILPDEARAELTLVPMAAVAAERLPLNRFRAAYIRNSVDLVALDEKTTLVKDPIGEIQIQQLSRFSPFGLGADALDALAHPENWSGIGVELRIIGTQPGLAERVAAVARKPLRGPEGLAEKYDLRAGILHGATADAGVRVKVLPCSADMALFINDRQVAEAQGLVAQVSDAADEGIGRVFVKFPIVPVETKEFPRFTEIPRGQKSTRASPPPSAGTPPRSGR